MTDVGVDILITSSFHWLDDFDLSLLGYGYEPSNLLAGSNLTKSCTAVL